MDTNTSVCLSDRSRVSAIRPVSGGGGMCGIFSGNLASVSHLAPPSPVSDSVQLGADVALRGASLTVSVTHMMYRVLDQTSESQTSVSRCCV